MEKDKSYVSSYSSEDTQDEIQEIQEVKLKLMMAYQVFYKAPLTIEGCLMFPSNEYDKEINGTLTVKEEGDYFILNISDGEKSADYKVFKLALLMVSDMDISMSKVDGRMFTLEYKDFNFRSKLGLSEASGVTSWPVGDLDELTNMKKSEDFDKNLAESKRIQGLS